MGICLTVARDVKSGSRGLVAKVYKWVQMRVMSDGL